MNRFLSIKPTKSLTYSSVILLVLGVFLLGYFYHYVPTNRQIIEKDGFLTLRTIAGNIADKNKGRQNLYKNLVDEARSKKTRDQRAHVDTLLKENNINASAHYTTNGSHQQNNQSKPPGFAIRDDSLVYQARFGKYGVRVTESIPDFLQPVLDTQRDELFDSYALAWVDSTHSKLVYHDENLGIRSDIRLDTLLSHNVQGYLAGVRDIQSPVFNHKLFYYPFKLGTTQLVLCGFARQDVYQQQVSKVPFHFAYPLAILFLLLLVFLPALKFWIMDADEQVGVSDMVLFGLSVMAGSSMLTLVIIQFLLWQGAEQGVLQNLKTLSDKIERGFVQELGEAYACADTLDALRIRKIPESHKLPENVDFSDSVRQFIRDSVQKSPKFYLFERVSWVDKSGQQRIKAEMAGKPVFANVKEREYVKAFRNDDAFTLPDGSDTLPDNADTARLFGWEPIYSQTNAGFNITLSKQAADGYVVALASRMYSVVDALLPVGYGFCLIDGDGKVLLHSTVSRNLCENLFEKVEPATGLRGFAAARQEADINEVSLYQKRYMLHIRPVRGLPYSLVTFYDKGFIVPVNMRILIFALLFSALSGLTCGLLWLLLARTNFRSHPLLYSPMDYLTWMIPQKRLADYYAQGLFFLIAYLIALLMFNLLPIAISSYTRFATVVLTPINVIGGLHVIGATFRRFNGPKTDTQIENGQYWLYKVIAAHLLISVLFGVISYCAGYPVDGWSYGLFQGAVIIWMGRYVVISRKQVWFPCLWRPKWLVYPVSYVLMLKGLIVNLAVLPAALYSWYGYRQERVQVVKKQQLHLANGLLERARRLTGAPGFDSLKNMAGEKYVKNRLIKQGIYTIGEADSIVLKNHARKTGPGSFERFYFTIAENLSNRYYDPKHYPALLDYSTDRRWEWEVDKGIICLVYTNPLPRRAAAGSGQYLCVASTLPDSSPFSPESPVWSPGGLMLLVLVVLLLRGLYEWLRVNTENVFLAKIVRAHTEDETDPPESPGTEPSATLDKPKVPPTSPAPLAYPWNLNEGDVMIRSRLVVNELGKREKKVAEEVHLAETAYEYKWKKRRQKEKCLLYDLAHDGLINYKNTDDIRRLIQDNILTVNDERLRFSDPGFRAFLVNKHGTDELKSLLTKYRQNSTWRSLQNALLLLLAGVAGFVFLTQEAAFNKVLAFAGGITTLLSILPKLFRSTGDGTDNKA